MSSGFWSGKPVLWRRIGKDEKGQVLALVLVAMAVGTLLIVPFLTQASTTLLSSRDYDQAIIGQYSADAGVEHAIWRLKYEPDFAASLTPATPTINYAITINNTSVNITVTWTEIKSPPNQPPPPEGPEATRVELSNSVAPESVPAGQPTTFTYAVSIKNLESSTLKIGEIRDLLPAGFSYVAGSSLGITTLAPTIEWVGGQQRLTWTFTSPRPSVSGYLTATLTFQATSTLQEDIYWNEVWARVSATSVGQVGTGSTAPMAGGGMSRYGYDILSNASGTAIRARASITEYGVSILSWQVE